jgi:hypothetical protein
LVGVSAALAEEERATEEVAATNESSNRDA